MSWQKVKLKEVCEVIAGQSPPSSTYNYVENGLPFFQGKTDFGNVYPKVRMWCSEPNKIAQPHDVLLSVRAPVGPTNICNIKSCIGRGLAAIRSNGKTDPKFVYYFFQFIEPILSTKGNGSTFSAITIGDVKELDFPLPPLPIQQKIAAILDQADALRKKDQQMLAKYDELLQAVFYDMFGDPVRNEKGWEKCCLQDVSIKITDGEHQTPVREKSGYKLLSARNIRNGYIDFNAGLDFIGESEFKRISKRCNPEFGDLLISCSGSVGRVTSVKINEPFSLVRSVALVKLKREILNELFAENLFHTDYMQNQILKRSKASSQANLFTGPIKELEVIVPPQKTQVLFVKLAENIQTQKLKIEQQIQQSENLFESLLQRAFMGELAKE